MIESTETVSPDAYRLFVGQLFSGVLAVGPDHEHYDLLIALNHSINALMGEVGEASDVVKAGLYYGRPVNFANLIEELGDIEFYLEATYSELGVSRAWVQGQNVGKLRKRFPGGTFSATAANARADKETSPLPAESCNWFRTKLGYLMAPHSSKTKLIPYSDGLKDFCPECHKEMTVHDLK